MIIYEVNLDVDNEIAAEYAGWLEGHIREVLEIDGFTGAEWLTVESDDPARTHWSVQYHVIDREHLERYFQQHAARLRQDGVTRFADRLTASRRIMETRKAYTG